MTLGGLIRVESGPEHELVRELDRDPNVVWMVSQPVRLSLVTAESRSRVHTPDLLVLERDGEVAIWDVAAAMNRIVHHPDVLTLKGSSYRLRVRGIDSRPSIRTTTDQTES